MASTTRHLKQHCRCAKTTTRDHRSVVPSERYNERLDIGEVSSLVAPRFGWMWEDSPQHDHLRSSPRTRYPPDFDFFFDFKDKEKRSLENPLCSLAWQMYHIGDKARQVLDNDRALCPVQERPTLCYLSSCVCGMLGCYHQVRVIIHALDECTTKRDLLS